MAVIFIYVSVSIKGERDVWCTKICMTRLHSCCIFEIVIFLLTKEGAPIQRTGKTFLGFIVEFRNLKIYLTCISQKSDRFSRLVGPIFFGLRALDHFLRLYQRHQVLYKSASDERPYKNTYLSKYIVCIYVLLLLELVL